MNPPSYPHRFLMYDYARGRCVRESFLAELLTEARRLSLTGLAVYIEDLGPFDGLPGTVDSIRPEGWKRLDEHAASLGLELLPLLNLSGHSEQTLAHPEYADLRGDDRGTVLDYRLPGTRPLVSRVLDRVMTIFSSPRIHIGFDEAWGLGQREERRAGRALDLASIFVRDITWVAGEVVARGRRPMFWGDVPGVYYPEVIGDIPRSLIPVDWFYRVEPEYPAMRRWEEAGFEHWVAPTLGYSEPGLPDAARLQRHARRVLAAGAAAGAAGVIFTAWEQPVAPYRARLPLAAWEAAQSRAPWVWFFETALAYHTPRLGGRARDYVRASRALGAAGRLLPAEATAYHPLRVREAWYRRNPHAPRLHARLRRLLDLAAPLAAPFPELALAWRHARFRADLFSPEPPDTARLRQEAGALCAALRDSWSGERLPEAFERIEKPGWERLIAALSEKAAAAPAFARAEVRVLRARPAAPQVEGFLYRKGYEGEERPETDPTRVFFWQDGHGRAFHALFHCRQGAPARGVETGVDFVLTRDDAVGLSLDFHGDASGFLWIIANAAGTVFCQRHTRDNANRQWDPLAGGKGWGRAVAVEGGWGVHLEIPFADLGIAPPPPGHRFGLSMQRYRNGHGGPDSLWGGLGWVHRDAPDCLASLRFE